MRILVVNWQDRLNPQAGGAEVHLHEIFGRLATWGHEVTAIVSGFSQAGRVESLDGMEIHRVGGRHSFSFMAPGYFRRRWAPGNFDIIVEDLNKVPVFMPLFARAPVVLLVHHLFGATAFREASFPVAAATWLLERPIPMVFKDCPVIAVSRSTAEDLIARGWKGEPPVVIPNGLDLDRFDSVLIEDPFPDPTLLFVGRLKRYKGIHLVLHALARLKAEGTCPSFLIAGKGDDEARLKRMVGNLGLEDVVRFLGFVPEEEKLRLLRRSWIHVLTSPKEGWGITAMEAAAAGTPTIASNSPGLRDAVQDGKTGLLLPHGDVPALTNAIASLIADEGKREAMGQAAREHAKTHSWDRSARDMMSFLKGRLAQGRRQT